MLGRPISINNTGGKFGACARKAFDLTWRARNEMYASNTKVPIRAHSLKLCPTSWRFSRSQSQVEQSPRETEPLDLKETQHTLALIQTWIVGVGSWLQSEVTPSITAHQRSDLNVCQPVFSIRRSPPLF